MGITEMAKSNGYCYVCGKECKPVAMKNHILKSHFTEGDEHCYLLLLEGFGIGYPYHYWLIAEAAKSRSFSTIDTFLREIWLECCGHLSEFRHISGRAVGKARKIEEFDVGDKIVYEYDFGSTTRVFITFLAEVVRPKQRRAVGLVARNVPLLFKCKTCGKDAAKVCCECGGMYDEMFFCDKCFGKHNCQYKNGLPVTNSPRCGECGYCGEYDRFKFMPEFMQKGPRLS
jgi:ribosomal protein L32